MRKFIVLLVACAGFFACSDDDKTTPNVTTGTLQGSWQLKAEYNNGVRQGLDHCRLQESLQFDVSALIVVTSVTNENGECHLTATEGSYERNGNNLVFNVATATQTELITELTDTKLAVAFGTTMQEYERL